MDWYYDPIRALCLLVGFLFGYAIACKATN